MAMEIPGPQPSGRLAIWWAKSRLFADSLRDAWGLFARSKVGVAGLAIIALYLLFALAHPVLMNTVWKPNIYDPIVGYDPREIRQPAPPGFSHPLGTDPQGRDVLSQLMASTRSEFILGVIAALVTVSIATVVGAASAYFGGILDAVLMRFVDVVIMMPLISVLIVLSGFLEVGLFELGLLIGVLGGFGGTGIILKSQALKVKVKPYIEAARVAGGGHFHIIFVHIIPNLIPLSFLYMMFTVAGAIFSEAILSYLGLMNIRISWGMMLNVAQTKGYLLQVTEFWWLVLPASLSVTLLSASFYLVGRALDEVVNPRLRKL
jgi:peptide/nickel transport system permease protein